MAEPRPRRLVVISDFCDGMPPSDPRWSVEDFRQSWLEGKRGPAPATTVNPDLLRQEVEVCGGYLERLPLASIRQGLRRGGDLDASGT